MSQVFICMAMVCRSVPYKDQDCMLTLLSPEYGQISAIARGCKKTSSHLAAASQLFAYGEYSFRERNGRISLVQCDLRESFFDLAQNYQAFSVGQFVLQACADAAQVGQSCHDLFSLAYYVLSYLCYGNGDVTDICIYFLLNFLQLQGLRPSTTTCGICGESTFANATFHEKYGALCSRCSKQYTGKAIQALSLEAMFRMMRLPLKDLSKLNLPPKVRNEIIACLPAYFNFHTERHYSAFRVFLQSLMH